MSVSSDEASVEAEPPPRSIALPGTLLGVGLGGFVDGILLHQILQWHHMLSSTDTDNIGVEHYSTDTVAGLKVNAVWDGLFHAFTWLAVLLGLWLLYSQVTRSSGKVWSSRVLAGWILSGWGVFNIVEGVVNHHLLGIHHVRSGVYQTWWDIGFLVVGALLVVGGWLLLRTGNPIDLTGRARAVR